MRQRIEQRRLPRICVSHQRHSAKRDRLPRPAPQRPLPAHRFDGTFDFSDALANSPPVGFEFLLARSARADSAAQSRKFALAPGEPWQQIIELRKFDLELSLAAVRMARENIEDQLRAVDDAAICAALDIAMLDRRKIAVQNNQARVQTFSFLLQFHQHATADQRGGVERVAHLQTAAHNFRSCTVHQFLEFNQRFASRGTA